MKTKHILVALASAFFTTSCDDGLVLYPLDQPNADTFYTNETEIQGGINACYGQLLDVSGGYGDVRFGMDGLAETLFLRSAGEYNTMVMGSHDYKCGISSGAWSRLYQGVARCNLLLTKIEENQDKLSEEKRKQFFGEALFLRGYYYLRLTQHFGDVIYTDRPITDMNEALTVTRTDQKYVYERIIEDFQKSADFLRDSNEKTLGRATWGAAMSYMARAALYQGDWALARDAAAKVIDSQIYDLYPNYADLFSETGVRSPLNKEQIFTFDHDLMANRVSSYLLYAGSRAMGGWSTIVPTQQLIDSYECVDGLDISASPLFDKSNPYANRDPRLKHTVVLPGDFWYGTLDAPQHRFDTHYDSMTTVTVDGTVINNPDCYQRQAFTSFTGYLLKKYVDIQYQSSSSKQETPFMFCRFAEVLLTYAEAKVELNELDASCLDAINRVRTQRDDVKMPPIGSGLTQAEMRRAVRHERKIELAAESLRLQDLRRWRRAEVLLNGPILGRPVVGDFTDYPNVTFDEYGDPIYQYSTYKPHPSSDYRVVIEAKFNPQRDYLWGIPEKDLALNPGLGQNPGY